MLGFVLLVAGVALMLLPFLLDVVRERTEAKRYEQKVALRRHFVGTHPDSPSAFENMGDAMREAGYLEEAIASYQIAKELVARGGINKGGGDFHGAGLDSKLRLTHVELAQERTPEQYESTLQTRPPVCPKCGHLGWPGDRDCTACHAALPVDSVFDTWRRKPIRSAILRETAQMVSGLLIIWAAMLFINALPELLRITVSVAACFVIPLRLLKRIDPDYGSM